MDEVSRLKARYAQQIEDGKKVSTFTDTPEWQWYVNHVVKPTIEDYTARIIRGDIASDKEDWILRGTIQGLQMILDATDSLKLNAKEARKKAKEIGGVNA